MHQLISTVEIEDISRTPAAPSYDDSVVVSANVVENVAVDEMTLAYGIGSSWYNVSMGRAHGSTFEGTIPPQPYETVVQYKVYAKDTNGNWVVSSAYSYTVSDDVPPEIVSIEWEPEHPSENTTVVISANISEPSGASGVSGVSFSFRDCFDQVWTTTMSYDALSGLWMVVLPPQPHNATVQFSLTACDNAGNAAMAESNYEVLPEFSSLALLIGTLMLTSPVLYGFRRCGRNRQTQL
jgi:hypothetical protein